MNAARVVTRVMTRVLPLALAAATCCAVAVQAQTAPWPSAAPQQPAGPAWPSAQPAPPQQPAGPAWPSAPPATQQPPGPWPSAQPSAPTPMSIGPGPAGPGAMQGPGPTPEQQKCLQEFTNLRIDVERRAKIAEAEGHKKERPTREKMCELITGYSTAELKWLKFIEANMSKCGIPPQIAEQIKTVHVRTNETKKKLCSAGPTQAQGPATPSLSDALGASLVPNDEDEKKKRKIGGTMDTLTGPVLSR
jgi:hypothetical protein